MKRFVKALLQQIDESDLFALAAEMAFGLLLALFPGMLISVSLLALVQNAYNVQYITGLLSAFLPSDIYASLGPALKSLASSARERSILTITTVTGFLSIASVFLTVIKAQEKIHAVPATSFFRRAVRSITITLILTASLFVIVNVIFYYIVVQYQIVSRFQLWVLSPFILRARYVLASGFIFIAAILIYRYSAPVSRSRFYSGFLPHWKGAAFLSLTWILLTESFGLIVSYQTPSGSLRDAYSYVGRMSAMMLYLYFSSFLFLVGAAINQIDSFSGEEPQPEASPDPEHEETEYTDDLPSR
jgi:membrane protein